VIPFPKFAKAGLEFSPDGEYMALAHREKHKDIVRIYSAKTFALLRWAAQPGHWCPPTLLDRMYCRGRG
jgi:hypothetical protein